MGMFHLQAITFYVSTALFALFGLKMLKEAHDMSPNEGQEEYEEAQVNCLMRKKCMKSSSLQQEVQKKEDEYTRLAQSDSSVDLEAGSRHQSSGMSAILKFVSNIFIESFTLTFLAEWGDRSQITTIILAAREVCWSL